MSYFGPCFGFLEATPLGFKARVGSALFALRRKFEFIIVPAQCFCLATFLCLDKTTFFPDLVFFTYIRVFLHISLAGFVRLRKKFFFLFLANDTPFISERSWCLS